MTPLPLFGDPPTNRSLHLCVYGPNGLVLDAIVPRDGMCGARPCWRATSQGYQYRDAMGVIDGVEHARLTARPDGGGRLALRGEGAALPLPPTLALAGPLTVQVSMFEPGIAFCWESVFPALDVATDTELRAGQ